MTTHPIPAASLRESKDRRRASLEELAKRIEEAMNEITNLPVGAIGEGGPTIDALDAHVDATGHSWDDDAEYHTGQRAWRILEQAQAIVRQYAKEVRLYPFAKDAARSALLKARTKQENQ